MSRSLALAIALTASLGAAGCHTAQPSPLRAVRIMQTVDSSPPRALDRVKSVARAHGWRVLDEGADSVMVDFGVQTVRIPVSTQSGLWGPHVSVRETEVHGSALYTVSASANGTVVELWSNATYWHPDYKCWLPGPFDISPGTELLARVAEAP